MSVMKLNWDRLVRDADGMEGVEYAVMAALVVSALVAALVSLGVAITGGMGEVTTLIQI
jgi:Flp pilus assembly pilin Flp